MYITSIEDIQLGKIYRIHHKRNTEYIVPIRWDESAKGHKRFIFINIEEPEGFYTSLSDALLFRTYDVELVDKYE